MKLLSISWAQVIKVINFLISVYKMATNQPNLKK